MNKEVEIGTRTLRVGTDEGVKMVESRNGTGIIDKVKVLGT